MKRLVGLLVCVMITGCAGKTKDPDQPGATVQDRMRSFSDSLVQLFPLIVSQKEFTDPSNQEKIEDLTHKMSREAKGLFEDHSKLKGDIDPSLMVLATNLNREVSSAAEAMRVGNRDYARILLRNATSSCIQCHTRNTTGPQFGGLLEGEWTKKLSTVDKAELSASLRQFDQALDLYMSILESPKSAHAKSFEWEQSAQAALAISLRVKRDPDMALKIVDKILKAPDVILFFKDDAREWQKILIGWKADGDYAKVKTKDLLTAAKGLLAQADKRFLYQGYRASLVIYLRASGYLHEFLKTEQPAEKTAEALFLLGRSYEAIEDSSGRALGPLYYRECIHRSPHSKQAQQCFEAYEENMFVNFIRGGGLTLSPDVRNYLEYLEKLAAPAKKESM